MPACDNCGTHVSSQYYRVFEVDGQLYGCYSCGTLDGNHGPDRDQQRAAYTGRRP